MWASSGTLPPLRENKIPRTLRAPITGVVGIAGAWETGYAIDGTDALFAPWDAATDQERGTISKFFTDRPETADRLWLAARNACV